VNSLLATFGGREPIIARRSFERRSIVHFSVRTAALCGVEAYPIDAEVDITPAGDMGSVFVMVGLPDTAVRESRERIRSAIANSGFRFPAMRVTVNLAPADLKKAGSAFDLPVAVAILAACGALGPGVERIPDTLFYGELGLDGRVRAVRGALAVAVSCRRNRISRLVVAAESGRETSVVDGVQVHAVASLADAAALVRALVAGSPVAPLAAEPEAVATLDRYDVDFADVKGQQSAKRALEVAAAGEHNVLMIGPPGSGKTMLARRLPTILPPFTFEEALETSVVHSVAGLVNGSGLVTTRPFRAPHHTVSDAGIAGGGSAPRPGEVSLAHNGVLFLDELPEFDRNALEVLRQPLEDGVVTISRANGSLTFPARFMLVAAFNPCPCGRWGDPTGTCRCTPFQMQRYVSRVSGPLLDRFDIQIEVPALRFDELSSAPPTDASAAIRERVLAARARQQARFRRAAGRVWSNARMTPRMLRAHCAVDDASKRRLEEAVGRMGLSARAYDRILKVARTVADLAGRDRIGSGDIAEAVRYRSLDRSYWSG
jgi:magnesium chelatase family protein